MFSRDPGVKERLDKLERRADELEHRVKMLLLEWEETYEKIANNLRKLGRRAELLQKESDGGKPPLSESEQEIANAQSDLTESRRRAIEMVQKRRAGGLNGVLR